jgi:ribonuclease-3
LSGGGREEGGEEAEALRRDGALGRLEDLLGHPFQNRELLTRALTHPSSAQEAGRGRDASYERMEFLGDSLLNFVVAELLWEAFPALPEGDLTKLRAHWVSGANLARVAAGVGIAESLRLGVGDERRGGRENARLLACALEAVVAATYLDGGWRAARAMVRRLFRRRILDAGLRVLREDHKTVLQERRQARGLPLPLYRSEADPAGFRCELLLDGAVAGRGTGRSRKSAEQAAAADALGREGE